MLTSLKDTDALLTCWELLAQHLISFEKPKDITLFKVFHCHITYNKANQSMNITKERIIDGKSIQSLGYSYSYEDLMKIYNGTFYDYKNNEWYYEYGKIILDVLWKYFDLPSHIIN